MPSQLSQKVEARRDLADLVRKSDSVLLPMLMRHSPTSRAMWDLSADQMSRDILTLYITDKWGSAAGDFAPEELRSEGKFQNRINELIGEMIMPRRAEKLRSRIELRDAFVSTDQLDQLRQRLGKIDDIERAQLRMNNQVRFLPQRPANYLLTDFAIEVDKQFEEQVRTAVVECGFQTRKDPFLIRREGVRDALIKFLEQQRHNGQPAPKFALCFQLQDRETIHLLEVSEEAAEVDDGSINGVGFEARGLVPHAHILKIYLVHPNDLFIACDKNRDHPLFDDLRNGNCEFLTPDDGGAEFRKHFEHRSG